MSFILHSNLHSKSHVLDLELCSVLLEDNRYFPWIFLVPRKNNIKKIIDLNSFDQQQLFLELELAQKVMWNIFQPDQLNVAAIGNKTPQLHVHIIARYQNDPAWPNTVWEYPGKIDYSPLEKEKVIKSLRASFSENSF